MSRARTLGENKVNRGENAWTRSRRQRQNHLVDERGALWEKVTWWRGTEAPKEAEVEDFRGAPTCGGVDVVSAAMAAPSPAQGRG